MLDPPTFTSDDVHVAPSPIHGNGLFASKDLPAKYKVADYKGHTMHITEFIATYGRDYQYTYKMTRANKVIVGKDPPYLTSNPSHYCNEGEANVMLVKGGLFTIRPIVKGEELLLNYGRLYPRPWVANKN